MEPPLIVALVQLLPKTAEMIGRAAERKRQAQRGKPRQEYVELPGIFGGEKAREPAIRGVVDGEAGLHAGNFGIGEEHVERAAKLIALRPVLGVIDDSEGALGEG